MSPTVKIPQYQVVHKFFANKAHTAKSAMDFCMTRLKGKNNHCLIT